mmetsp:Transcript_14891/g.50208  ORF Transcript_14891/g.50208 Transcript_14891/m.50208 type:complete len:275 (-) Transcript_14891:1358-2182(-)
MATDKSSPALLALRPFAPGVFVSEAFITFMGFPLQTRMAAIKLSDGRLVLYSPTPLTPKLSEDIETLGGQVAAIVTPNKYHNMTLGTYCKAYPGAMLLAPPGLAERCPHLKVSRELATGWHLAIEEGGWGDEIDVVVTAGNVFFSEAVLLHRASGTVLVGDIVENLTMDTTPSAWGRAVNRLFRLSGRPMPAPEHCLFTLDASRFRESVAPIRAWTDVRQLFLCHGDPIVMAGGSSSRPVDVLAAVLDEVHFYARVWGWMWPVRQILRFMAWIS